MCLAATGCAAPQTSPGGGLTDAGAAPAWLYPMNPPPSGPEKAADAKTPVRLPNSRQEFLPAQLTDRFSAPDWHPQSHSPMPEIVVHGRAPDTYACGFCHLPGGQGRPENAALAGLPAAYIVQQVADLKAGTRRSAWHGGPYLPLDLMRAVAMHATASDVLAAAEYFSAQTLTPRVTVIERKRIPHMRAVAWIYVKDSSGGDEALGQRIIEWAPDLALHEHRDDEIRYIAFVPTGSVARGREIALQGLPGITQSCSGCHGRQLQGMGLIPPLAGRSPSYLLRQLIAFQTKDRNGLVAAPMQAVVAKMQLADLIAVSAYAAADAGPNLHLLGHTLRAIPGQ